MKQEGGGGEKIAGKGEEKGVGKETEEEGGEGGME